MKPTSLPPAPRADRTILLLTLALVALAVASFATLPLEWGMLFSSDAAQSMLEFVRGFLPPETNTGYLHKLLVGSVETLSMSTLGTAIAVVAGLALALPASGRFGATARGATRLLLNALRSVPELAWAALLLIAAGLGPFAGTLALAAHTSGVLGRLFGDTLENLPPLPEQSLRINGAPALAAFFYAALPQALPQMLSYTLYRWENNIRAAAILGVVGAGGLGQMLKYHLSLFQMHRAASVIIAMLLLVAAVDAASYAMRRHMMR